MPLATHKATIPIAVEIDADHQDQCVPEAQAVWVRVPPGAKFPMKIDAAGHKYVDIADLVLVDSQKEAWDAIQAEMKDADASVLDSEPYPTHMEPA